MRTLRRHWYNIGLVVAVAAALCLWLVWAHIDVVQRLLALNFIAILAHQFEEYGWPGGEPAIMNMVLRQSDRPDRYPLNQNSAMIVNVLASYAFYLIPVFLPNVIWLGLAPVLFGMVGQFIVHGILTNYKMRTFYNPGFAAVLLLHIPIGAYYIYYVHANNLIGAWDWVIGVIYMVVFTFVSLVKMTYAWLADKDSPYVFADEEMSRFGVKHRLEYRP